jgi:hypothetical protein
MSERELDKSIDRRSHPRHAASLPARYVLENRYEYFGKVIDASPAGLAIEGAEGGHVGDSIVVDVDGVDRFWGEIVRLFPGGFAVKLVDPLSTAAMALADALEGRRAGRL